jgi:outer membrane protein TolC
VKILPVKCLFFGENVKNSRYYLIFLSLLSFSARANLVPMVRELIQNNFEIVATKAKIERSKNEIEAFYAKMPWSFFYKGSATQDKRDYLIQNINYNAEFWNNEIGIEKPFMWGGEFKYRIFTSNQYRYENNAAVKYGDEPAKVFELLQNFNYVQDLGQNLFGREEYKEVEIREKNEENSVAASDLEIESKVLEFFRAYIDVRLLKTVVIIEKNATARTNDRVLAIGKMVKNGLRLKVDLLEAQYQQVQYEENYKRALVSLGAALEDISNLLHREVKEDELLPLEPFQKILPLTLESKGEILENKDVKYLGTQIEVLGTNLQKIDYGFFPELNIEADYLTNAIEPTRTAARQRGFFGGAYEAKGIINLKWPLGYPEKETDRIRANIDLNTLKVEKNSKINNLKNTEKFIFYRLKHLEEVLNLGKKRWEISKEVVKSYDRLYGLGKTGILESLTAEENRIFTERAYMLNLAEREKLYASLGFIWGRLKDTIMTLK